MRSTFAATLLAIAAMGAASTAHGFDPTGLWEPDNRESRYEISWCAEATDQLCARLVWIREDVQDARNMRFLNQYMFRNARHTQPDVWRGTVHYQGLSAGGTLTQTAENAIRVEACFLFVVCERIALSRVQ